MSEKEALEIQVLGGQGNDLRTWHNCSVSERKENVKQQSRCRFTPSAEVMQKNDFITGCEGMETSAVSRADLFSRFKTCQASRLGPQLAKSVTLGLLGAF